jgi:lipopolysaccharide/colanic/teichoic acid biosynthesis glycosyltransferase
VLKRALDCLASLLLLALAMPFWASAWLAARIDRSGPLLTCQAALGQRRAPFSLIGLAAPLEPRPSGRPARWAWSWRRLVAESRLGKLPNVVNVLRGHMSLVGPRAVVESGRPIDEPWLRNLLRVRPGLTGPAADGSRGGGAEEQTLKDIAYVRDYSVWLDLRLIFASLKRLLQRRKSLPSSYQPARRKEAETPAATVVERTT